jgi:hypothetical protein
MFPVDDVVSSSSVQQIINSLAAFSYGHTAACVRCNNRDWESVVLKAKANANQYFDGLCLDCMDRSNPQGKDLDDDYWKHNQNANGRWTLSAGLDTISRPGTSAGSVVWTSDRRFSILTDIARTAKRMGEGESEVAALWIARCNKTSVVRRGNDLRMSTLKCSTSCHEDAIAYTAGREHVLA